jgi:uncharacterized protein YcaQ
MVMLSRLSGWDPRLGEELLRPGVSLFEYWGHEASWMPLELYPVFEFRRKAYRSHPWWGDLIGEHPQIVTELLNRIRNEGPLRSLDFEGRGSRGWWDLKLTKRVAAALWSSGELAIRERRSFQRIYDLTERVIPAPWRRKEIPKSQALATLLIRALKGHGWASTGTLARTWRLTNQGKEIQDALKKLTEEGEIVPCALVHRQGRPEGGWIRPDDLDLASRLRRTRPPKDRGVLLSPFDPLLWDRPRVKRLFDFDQILEIFKPAPQRVYGYYCLPVLAGDRLVARVDLKAHRKEGWLEIRSLHYERGQKTGHPPKADRKASRTALDHYSGALQMEVANPPAETI